MNEHWLVYALLGFTAIRELVFQYSTHKLLNKLMSRNYYDFKITEKNTRIKEDPAPVLPVEEVPDDLGALSGIFG